MVYIDKILVVVEKQHQSSSTSLKMCVWIWYESNVTILSGRKNYLLSAAIGEAHHTVLKLYIYSIYLSSYWALEALYGVFVPCLKNIKMMVDDTGYMKVSAVGWLRSLVNPILQIKETGALSSLTSCTKNHTASKKQAKIESQSFISDFSGQYDYLNK